MGKVDFTSFGLTPEVNSPPPKPEAPSVSLPAPQSAKTPKVPESVSSDVPTYLTFERKETRVRRDQYEWLTVKSRSFKAKKGAPRITENTLMRVAIDLLHSKADRLKGSTEQELRRSVGLS